MSTLLLLGSRTDATDTPTSFFSFSANHLLIMVLKPPIQAVLIVIDIEKYVKQIEVFSF
jgi:hypothetical protein